jgi:hypothetical protein
MFKRIAFLLLLLLFTSAVAACGSGQPIQFDGGIEINPDGGQPSGDSAVGDNTLLTVGLVVIVVLLAIIAGALLTRGRS